MTSANAFSARIEIDHTAELGAVHDHLYGANLEHIGRSIYEGVWAELLRNRKFLGHDRAYAGLSEGLSHQHPSFGIVTPWEALAPDPDKVLFVHDHSTAYTGKQSQRITILEADGEQRGILQTGVPLVRAGDYEVSVVLKGVGQDVEVRLGDQVWVIAGVADTWRTYRSDMSVANADNEAVFSISHQAECDLFVGCASVMPSGHLDGFRPDAIDALREWGPTFLRWPGGNFASAYHWEQGIGDRDKRPGYLDPAWSLWEPNDVGTDEFIQLCRHVGTEPILTNNMGTGTPEEAARWIEYCNGGSETEMGRLRAANGHAEPHAVRTWFVGNEQFGNWQVGHCDAETYATRYTAFAEAMLAVDGSLDLIAVGAPIDLYGRWNELVLKGAGALIDKLSVHYYSIRTEKWTTPPPADELYWPKVASAHEVCEMLDRTWDVVREHADPPPAIIFDEWNTYVGGKPPDFFEDYGIADGIYTGALMNACLQRADWIKMSACFNLINVMGNYRITPSSIWKTPTTLVLELFTEFRGPNAVKCSVDSPTVATPAAGTLPAYDDVPLVDAAATFEPSDACLYLSVVNRDPERAVEIGLNGVARRDAARIVRVTGSGPQYLNTEESPRAVTTEEDVWPQDAEVLRIPAHTVAMVVLPLDAGDQTSSDAMKQERS